MKLKNGKLRLLNILLSMLMITAIGVMYYNTKASSKDEAQLYKVNKNGETYGPNIYNATYGPDLLAAIGENGVEGYVRAKDLEGEIPKNPEEALAIQRANQEKGFSLIPLYDKEGENIIGEFRLGSGR